METINMIDFRGLYIVKYHAPCYAYEWKSFILAENHIEAEYLWRMYLKQHDDIKDIWNECKKNCRGYANITAGNAKDGEEFSKSYPREYKKGVYEDKPQSTMHKPNIKFI